MLRPNRLQAAIRIAALFPLMAHSDVETFLLQIGKGQAATDTVTIRAEYRKPPEIPHPEGYDWAVGEKDSSWTDNAGSHFAYSHSFAATLGSRKGYGSDFINVDDFGTGKPDYSAGVIFTFPSGDTTLMYSWGPGIHMYMMPSAAPYSETGFISGCPSQGKVILYDGTGSGNLDEGQWAMLLARERERPAYADKPVARPGKETLRIQIGKEKEILDTLVIWTRYDAEPQVPDASGRKWADLEKDSAWRDSEGWNLRYSHSFLAMQGTRQGIGGDYIYLVYDLEDFNGLPRYTSILSIGFPGDTSEYYQWQPDHMADVPQAYPYDKSGFIDGGEGYGEVIRRVGETSANLAQGQWARILTREQGWIGYQTTALARGTKALGRADSWLIDLDPGPALRTPPGAKALRILDVQGRTRFEARNLTEGGEVALPGDLPRKALRIHWLRGPG
jgi:hypothetical protein